ncbi:XRE family transcriptional regulator [bacterium]|nr:MAG: XRE family transcriptional regulator [bacterium]
MVGLPGRNHEKVARPFAIRPGSLRTGDELSAPESLGGPWISGCNTYGARQDESCWLYSQLAIIVAVTKSEIGFILARARRRSGQTQADLAQAMGTTQPVVARAEAGYRMPTLGFIERWALATGAPIALTLGATPRRTQPASARRAMVRSVLGPGRFNPWERNPSPVEAELLERAGESRQHFERLKQVRGQRH